MVGLIEKDILIVVLSSKSISRNSWGCENTRFAPTLLYLDDRKEFLKLGDKVSTGNFQSFIET